MTLDGNADAGLSGASALVVRVAGEQVVDAAAAELQLAMLHARLVVRQAGADLVQRGPRPHAPIHARGLVPPRHPWSFVFLFRHRRRSLAAELT